MPNGFLTFNVGDDLYAIPVSDVIEIIPLVQLKPLRLAPPWVAGLFNYRGISVPVLDLCQLIGAQPYRARLSTRIIIVDYSQLGAGRPLGLVAERVTQTINILDSDFAPCALQADTTPFLAAVAVRPEGIVQRIEVARLLPGSARDRLFANAEI